MNIKVETSGIPPISHSRALWIVCLGIFLASLTASLHAATSGNFYYIDNGTVVTITGYSSYASGEATVPATINGKPVTAIGIYAFSNRTWLTGINIPASVTSIDSLAFSGCERLAAISVDSTNPSYSSLDGVLFDKPGTSLLLYPPGKSGVYTIPAGVISLRNGSFSGCANLTGVTIPPSVTSIGSCGFNSCTKLVALSVDPASLSYSSLDDVLFDKARSALIQYPGGKTGTYTIPPTVTSIGRCAFSACKGLQDVTIPDSVTSIGDNAFSFCTGLTSISIPSGVASLAESTFSCCYALASVSLSTGLSSIGDYAFQNCYSLTGINLPSGLTSIGLGAFSGCYNLSGIDLPSSLSFIGNHAFQSCSSLTAVTIPSGVSTIGEETFYGCSLLTNLVISPGITSIGNSAFFGCSSLPSITIPGSITSIGSYAFDSCTSLTNATILPGVTSIEYGAFQDCSGLASVSIPNTVAYIGGYAFFSCHNLRSLHLPSSLIAIGESAFSYCDGLSENLAIPSGVAYLANEVFAYCTGLTGVTIPSGVTAIGYGAFRSCQNLSTVTIPNTVTSIGASAFYGCTGLAKVTIPYHVASIGYNAFANCSNLFEAEFLGNAPSMETGVFDGTATWFSVKYYTGATGFTVPTWMGYASTEATFPILYTDTGNGIIITGFVNSQLPIYTPPFRDIPPYIAGKPVTGIGDGAFANCHWLENVTIPSGVTFIGNSAFACSSMAKVTIPASVISIGSNAFSQCHNLVRAEFLGDAPAMGYDVFNGAADGFIVEFHDNTTGFSSPMWMGYQSSNLDAPPFYFIETETEVTITGVVQPSASTLIVPATIHGKPVTAIASMALANGAGPTSVTIPATVTTIGDNWISGNNLLSISVDDSNPVYSSADGVLFDKGKTTLLLYPAARTGDYTIPDGITSIGKSAFQNCYYLTGVTIPSSVGSIGDIAFLWCNSLTSLTLPSGVVSIGSAAFEYCTGLTALALPDSVSSFAPDACYGCTGLAALSVDTANPNYSSEDGILFDKGKATLLLCPEGKTGACTIPSSVTSIADFAFRECTGLTSVVIPSGVTSIGNCTFRLCTGLTSVTFPSGLVSIGEEAFQYCRGLTSLSLPPSVSTIGLRAFYSCSGLTSIKIPSGVKSLGFEAFYWCNHLAVVEFLGNAPSISELVFGRNADGFTVKYHSSKWGFATPTWNGYPTERIVDAFVATSSLPHGTTGATYQQTLSATGGTAPYTWSLVSGSLPPGLALGNDGVISGTPASAGVASFIVQVSGSDGFATTASLGITISQPLTTWEESRFTQAEISSGRTSATADFDGDGVPNLLEYAFGGDPKNSDAAAIAPAPDTSGNKFQISFSCDSARSDITYTVQATSSLTSGTWTDIAQSVGGAPALPIGSLSTVSDPGTGLRKVSVTDSSALASGTQRFLRVKVTAH